MTTLSGNKPTPESMKIYVAEIMKTVNKQFFGCGRETHDRKSCPKECQFLMLQELKRNNDIWSPTNYPKDTFLSLAGYVEPPIECFYDESTLKRLGPSPYYNSSVTKSPAWLDYKTRINDGLQFFERPKKSVSGRPNPDSEVPSVLMKATTACKEATEAGHSQEAQIYGLAPAKGIEAGKSAEELPEKIPKENESLDCDVYSKTAAQLEEVCSMRLDCADEDELDSKGSMKFGTSKHTLHVYIRKRKRSIYEDRCSF